jgi:hypothetical protein
VVRSGLVGLLDAVRVGHSESLLDQVRQLVPQCQPPLRLVAPRASAKPRLSPAHVYAIPMLDTLYEESL